MFPKISIQLLLMLAVCCALFVLPNVSHAARILGFFPTPTKSHLLIHCSIAETLAKAGHDVTVIGGKPNVYKNSTYKYTNIEASGYNPEVMNKMIKNDMSAFKAINSAMSIRAQWANETLFNPRIQQFLKEHGEGSFDLLILGYNFNDFHLGVGAHLRCPIIISFANQPMYWMNKFIANPEDRSYVPALYLGLQQPMGFMQRIKNLLWGIFIDHGLDRINNFYNSPLYEHYFPPSKYPPFEEVAKNVSLIFTNHHSLSQGPIRPTVPALIEIGGIQIKEKQSPLPEDIAEFLDNAKEGAVYFSLGSNVDGSVISEPIAHAMFNVLSKIPYKVLWKWSDSISLGKSKNILFKNWLPQDDILAHPNIRLFITHAGQGSVVESKYHGVPMVAIPLFGDQPANAAVLEKSGFGVQLDYATLTEEKFRHAILEVLQNPKYAKTVKDFSKTYRDRPMTPRQLVTFWTEYVLRHKGAKHLQSPALELNTFQLLSLDVIAFLAWILFVVVFVLVKCCKFLCCKSKGSSQYRSAQKKKIN